MDDLRNGVDDLGFADGDPVAHPVEMDGEGAEWDTVEGALLTEAKRKLLCRRQIRANLERFSYKAKRWTPVHLHYSDYHQVYFWAMAFQQGASALTGSRA